MEYEFVRFEKEDGIGLLTLNRPEVMNAHNYEMKVELQTVAANAKNDDDVKVLIVTGAGRGFSAGEDVKQIQIGGDYEKLRVDQMLALLGKLPDEDWTTQLSPRYFYGYPKPTVAAVNGPAVGAGLSIAISCDVRIGSEGAGFGYFYTRRGLMGSPRAIVTLIQLIGLSRTLEMTLSGEMIDAQEAERVGLVSRIVPADQLLDEAKKVAVKMMRGGPLAQRAIKEAIYRTLYDLNGLQYFGDRVGQALIESEDHAEGSRAFAEKRPAVWKSR
jgi:enoyl-CoA hydratase/carnithine racemase